MNDSYSRDIMELSSSEFCNPVHFIRGISCYIWYLDYLFIVLLCESIDRMSPVLLNDDIDRYLHILLMYHRNYFCVLALLFEATY